MAEVTAAEVMPKVILRESLSTTGGTPVEKAARDAGKAILDKVKQNEWLKAIEETQRKKPIDASNIDKKAEQIGVERDPTTGAKKRTTPEEGRFNEFKKAAGLSRKFVEQGYDKLTPTEQNELRTIIKNKISSNPHLLSQFNALTPGAGGEQEKEIERRLRDPKFTASLSEIANGYIDPEKKLLDEDQIEIRKNDVDEKEYDKTEKEDAVNDLTGQILNLNTALQEFYRSPAGAVGTKALELDMLRLNLSATQVELQTHKETLEDAKAVLQDLIDERSATLLHGASGGRRDKVAIDADISAKRGEINTSQREVDKRQKDINRITELETQEETLKEAKLKAENEKIGKSNDYRKAELEWSKAVRRLDDLKRERIYQEQDLVDGMKGAFGEAADKYLLDEWKEVKTLVDTELLDMKQKASNADEQAMLDVLGKRWEGKERGFGKKKYRAIDREKVERDYVALKDKGPEFLMREILRSKMKPGSLYTDAQIDTMLADKSDGSFYKKMEPVVATQLIRRKMLAGGLRREDIFAIENASWGKGVIDQALQENTALRERFEKLTGEKAINPGFMSKLWEQTKKRPWLLAILLGMVVLPVLAAKEGTSSMVK